MGVFHRKAIVRMLEMQTAFTPCLLEARQFPEEHPKEYDPRTFDTPWVSGACLMIPVQIYERIGGFDDRFFMYMEDADLTNECARLKEQLEHSEYVWSKHLEEADLLSFRLLRRGHAAVAKPGLLRDTLETVRTFKMFVRRENRKK